jgi:hypothetical protein
MKPEERSISRAQVRGETAVEAVRNFHDAVCLPDAALVIFFCSPRYELATVAAEMTRCFGSIPVVGCTTAGELGPAGYADGSISGACFAASQFSSAARCIHSLDRFSLAGAQSVVQELLQELESLAPGTNADNTFGFLMIDGLSVREESVTRVLQSALGKIPLVGGSAGDGLNFGRTWVFGEGGVHANSAVLTLITCNVPFKALMTQHFLAADQRCVVTAADPVNRIVHEIDGRPAAEAYAELIGTEVAKLDPMHFAASPMTVLIGGTNYVRSISQALPDGSLKFFCAIEEGMVLRVTHAADLVANLEDAFRSICSEIGQPQIILGCECIMRRLEVEQKGLLARVTELMERNRVSGFVTYGEQYRGVHVNQTFSGIAIGYPTRGGHD